MNKAQERDTARELFFQTDDSQTEIARKVGVERKTVNLWVKNGKWRELKEAARRMPAILVDQYLYQLSQLNRSIEQRPDGQRFPDLKEAETMRKLIVCINGIQKQSSLSANVEVVQNFIGRINSTNNDLAKELIGHAQKFLFGQEKNGCHSFDLGYDIPDEIAEPDNDESEESTSGVNEESLESRSEVPGVNTNGTSLSLGEGRGEVSTAESLNIESLVPVYTIADAILYSDGSIVSFQNELNENAEGVNKETNTASLSSGEGRGEVPYYRRSWKDPDDPYTTYYACGITKREYWSPKYGLPPEGFRECPPTPRNNRKGRDKYGWPTG